MKIETYKKFYDPIEANIVASKLKANGIECFLTNEHASTLLWHLTVAHGGLNLMLDMDDFSNADRILNGDAPAKIEDIEFDPNEVRCPRCNSNNVKFGSMSDRKVNWWQIISLLVTAVAAPVSHEAYHCFNCNNNFELN